VVGGPDPAQPKRNPEMVARDRADATHCAAMHHAAAFFEAKKKLERPCRKARVPGL
jgi:hypothetical protein